MTAHNQPGDDAVRKATGRGWEQWCEVLDGEKAAELPHKQIAALLHTTYGLGSWWSQMVAVGYEQRRGLRKPHEKPTGFEISKTRTVAASLADAWQAWQDETSRRQWMTDHAKLQPHSETGTRLQRFDWSENDSVVAVGFTPKGEGKTTIVVQHGKLPDAAAAEAMKARWAAHLDALQDYLVS